MELFESHRKKFLRNMMVLFPVLFLVSVGLIFFLGLNLTSDETLAKEQQALEQALEQGAIRTYALSGQYPQSLNELLEDYHITYDHSHFVVEYMPNGSNLLPSISVIPLSGSFSLRKEAAS